MEFNMNKLLNENYKTIVNLLIYQLALSKSRLNGNRSAFDTLQELRTINIGCIRGSGTTQAVAELFDIKNDVYITSNMAMLYEFNERLYLCYKFGKNVDPMKDLVFNRPIPIEYKEYIDIISS